MRLCVRRSQDILSIIWKAALEGNNLGILVTRNLEHWREPQTLSPERLPCYHYCWRDLKGFQAREILYSGGGARRNSAPHNLAPNHLGLTLPAEVPNLAVSLPSLVMYDDASYYTFIPSAQEEKSQKPKQKRRQSLLKQPAVSTP